MQVSVEESGKIQRKVMVSIPSQKIDSAVVNRLRDVGRKARIPGFRPGKAPQKVIRKRYETQVTEEVLAETINSSYQDALNQVNILPAGLLSIDRDPYEAGRDLEFVFTVELFPEIQHLSLEGKTIEQPVVEVTDEDVERVLHELGSLNPEYVETEDETEIGNRVIIDAEPIGLGDNEILPIAPVKNYPHVVGKHDPYLEFDRGLQGAVKGDRRRIPFTFPENWDKEELAGREIEFDVMVRMVEKPQLVELDDDFALAVGVSEGGIKELRKQIRDNLKRAVDTTIHVMMITQLLDVLMDRNEMELPTVMVFKAAKRRMELLSEMLDKGTLPADSNELTTIHEYAERTVAQGLLVQAVVDKYAIKIDRKQLEARARTVLANHKDLDLDLDLAVEEFMRNPEKHEQIQNLMIEEQVISHLLETADVHPRKMTYDELMYSQKEEKTV